MLLQIHIEIVTKLVMNAHIAVLCGDPLPSQHDIHFVSFLTFISTSLQYMTIIFVVGNWPLLITHLNYFHTFPLPFFESTRYIYLSIGPYKVNYHKYKLKPD